MHDVPSRGRARPAARAGSHGDRARAIAVGPSTHAARSHGVDAADQPARPHRDARRPLGERTPRERRHVQRAGDRRPGATALDREGRRQRLQGPSHVADAVLSRTPVDRRARGRDRLSALVEGSPPVKALSRPAAVIGLLLALSFRLDAQVTSDRLLRANEEPQNWLTYSGTYFSQRYTPLKQIDANRSEE